MFQRMTDPTCPSISPSVRSLDPIIEKASLEEKEGASEEFGREDVGETIETASEQHQDYGDEASPLMAG